MIAIKTHSHDAGISEDLIGHGKCRGIRPKCLCCSSIQAQNLVQKRSAFKGGGWPPAQYIGKKEAKPLRSEINEAVKLNVPEFANLVEILRQLRHVVAFLGRSGGVDIASRDDPAQLRPFPEIRLFLSLDCRYHPDGWI